MHSKKLSGYKVGIKFDKDSLAVEQNNYATKIVNAYIVCDVDAWPRNSTNNFKFKNCVFGAASIVKNINKEKWVYSGYGIAFDGAGLWNFGNDFARNVVIFGVDSSSSSHADNRKNNFLLLGEGSFGSSEKKFSINFINYHANVNEKFDVRNCNSNQKWKNDKCR